MRSPRKARRRQSRFFTTAEIVKALAISAGCIVVLLLSFAVSIAAFSRAARPELAATYAPFDARAKAKIADDLVTKAPPNARARARARELAETALRRDATIVQAWRTLAVVEGLERRAPQSSALFHIAERMSRRDLVTQLWFIEERVQRDDIAGALRHYDIALRTNSSAREFLLPILVRATSENDIVQPLAILLRGKPLWRRYFLAALSENPPSAENAARLVNYLAVDGPIDDGDVLAPLLPKLVEMRAFEPAAQVYQLLSRARHPRTVLLRNGRFDRLNGFPPFDWALSSGADLSASQVAGEQSALQVRASGGHGGLLARQLVMLRPGTYALSWRSGALEGSDAARLRWTVTCADVNGQQLLSTQFASVEGLRPQAAELRVPAANCSAQWLDLSVEADFEPGGVGGWIGPVNLAPRSGAS